MKNIDLVDKITNEILIDEAIDCLTAYIGEDNIEKLRIILEKELKEENK